MISIDISLWPHGFANKAENLGRIEIINDSSGTATRGNYKVILYKKNSTQIWKQGEVKNFPRKRLGSYDLLLRGLKAVGLEERNSVNS